MRLIRGALRIVLGALSLILWIVGGSLVAVVYVYSILIGESRRVASKRNCK